MREENGNYYYAAAVASSLSVLAVDDPSAALVLPSMGARAEDLREVAAELGFDGEPFIGDVMPPPGLCFAASFANGIFGEATIFTFSSTKI